MKRIEDLQTWKAVLSVPRAADGRQCMTIEAEMRQSQSGHYVSIFDAQTSCAEQVAAARAETVREALAKMTPEQRLRLFAEFCCNCGGTGIAGICTACKNHGEGIVWDHQKMTGGDHGKRD